MSTTCSLARLALGLPDGVRTSTARGRLASRRRKPLRSRLDSWCATDDDEVRPDRLADLAHRRGIAAPLDGLGDDVEDLALAGGQAVRVWGPVGKLDDGVGAGRSAPGCPWLVPILRAHAGSCRWSWCDAA